MTIHENLILLEKFASAWNNHDLDTVMACMTPDCVYLAAAGVNETGQRFVGQEAVREAFEVVLDKFPDAAWRNAEHRLCGAHATTEWLFQGTAQGFHHKISVHGVDLFEFKEGRIHVKDTFRKQLTS